MSIEKLSPDIAALLVVDVQNDFCDQDGIMAKRGFDVGAIPEMVSRLESLVEVARQSSVPVVWIQTTHDDTTNSRVWLARQSPDLTAESPPPSNCWTGTWGAEPYRLIPEQGEPVVIKHRYSAFAGTDLVWTLRGLERESLLITGVSTEACVESTLRDGLFHDFHVSLVEDCCASYRREAHEATVSNARNLFGLVVSSEQLMSEWQAETMPRPAAAGA